MTVPLSTKVVFYINLEGKKDHFKYFNVAVLGRREKVRRRWESHTPRMYGIAVMSRYLPPSHPETWSAW